LCIFVANLTEDILRGP